MAKDYLKLVQELSLPELQKLLDIKQQLEKLEKRREELQGELAHIEKEMAHLQQGQAVRKRTTGVRKKRKTAKRTRIRKAAAAGKGKKRMTRKATGRVAGKGVRNKTARTQRKRTLEDVIVELITRHGGKMSVKEILQAIQEGQLYKSKSKNFENVLRRTLSTSQSIDRASRGVYKVK